MLLPYAIAFGALPAAERHRRAVLPLFYDRALRVFFFLRAVAPVYLLTSHACRPVVFRH